MANRMKGNASWTSPRRMVSVSTRPPTKPAMSPVARPRQEPMSIAAELINSELRPP